MSHSRPIRRRRAFTAIELTAVASIIALLALILLPIVRKRVAQSRLTAAQDDMRTIEIAQTFARADTGHYVRLIDLDNGPNDPGVSDLAVPRGYWNEPIPAGSFQPFRDTWDGPYTTFNDTKAISISELLVTRPELFRGLPSSPAAGADDGPILVLTFGTAALGNDFADPTTNRHPVDPWGSPYIFFGDSPIGPNGGTIAISTESNFSTATVYSLGPDGRPGDGSNPAIDPTDSANYFRETGVLGTGDDITRRF
jgi:type II secretory pathway pseudopilin PulG